MEFNEKLQELRKNRNLTQEQLAEQLYVSRTAISKWESGRGLKAMYTMKKVPSLTQAKIEISTHKNTNNRN